MDFPVTTEALTLRPDKFGFLLPAPIERQQIVLAKIREREPEAHVTFFPVERQFVVHVWGRELSGYHPSRAAALVDAYHRLYPEEK